MRFNRFVPSLSAATPIPNHRLRIFLSFVLFYVFLTLCARTRSFRDPGSVFFDPSTAYDLSYSAVRLEQADRYVDSAVSDTKTLSRNPDHCSKGCSLFQTHGGHAAGGFGRDGASRYTSHPVNRAYRSVAASGIC